MRHRIVAVHYCDYHPSHDCTKTVVKTEKFNVFGVEYETDFCQAALTAYRTYMTGLLEGARRASDMPDGLPTLVMETHTEEVVVTPGTEWWRNPPGADPATKKLYSDRRGLIKLWGRAQGERFGHLKMSDVGKLDAEVGHAWTNEVFLRNPAPAAPELPKARRPSRKALTTARKVG